MSISDWDIEPVDNWQGWCDVHGIYYFHGIGCDACKDDSADRDYDDLRDDQALAKVKAKQP